MRSSIYFHLLGIFLIAACRPAGNDHPQAHLRDPHQATTLTSDSILLYVQQMDLKLPQAKKQSSLLYLLGDISFYVEKYTYGQGISLLKEWIRNGNDSRSIKKYYFRNDSLLLYTQRHSLVHEDDLIVKDSRTFFRNLTQFRQENRTAASELAIKQVPFMESSSNQLIADQRYLENIQTLEEILAGSGRFEMAFEGMNVFPDARYLLLRSPLQRSYSATVLIPEKDAFIDSLLNEPALFKNRRIYFKWEIREEEAVYVPGSGSTSANGLNK